MDAKDDLFLTSSPTFQSPVRIVDTNEMDSFNESPYGMYGSPNFTFDANAIDDAFNAMPDAKPSANSLAANTDALPAASSKSSPQDTSSDSQRGGSIDSSDGSSGDLVMQNAAQGPGRIAIPSEVAEDQPLHSWNGSPNEDNAFGNDLFDFDSAASSPVNFLPSIGPDYMKIPLRPGTNAPFGRGRLGSGFSGTYEGSSLSVAARKDRSHARQVSDAQPQYVTGSSLQATPPMPGPGRRVRKSASPTTPTTHMTGQELPKLHVSSLPKTQRVETQMHTRLTIWPLPPGVTKLHFQGYTMARTKLVIKPPPEKVRGTLELYAHCVCATAMEDPAKLQKALARAAQSTREDSGNGGDGTDESRDLSMADDDPRKPMNGGFVFICDQCIRRENKRIARKKLKNEDEEESWLEEQPKRIIVFNKAEVMDWQNWQSYEGDDEPEDGTLRPFTGNANFPEGAMQIRFPMRIQCYSRHHGEKLGYRVIFTIKDWQDRVVAQTITNPVVITDDHKAPQSTRMSGEIPAANYAQANPVHGLTAPEPYGNLLANRNSFSTPNLQSLQHHQFQPTHTRNRPSSNFSGPSHATRGTTGSSIGSRPASPTAPSAPQTKRRKGSGSSTGKLRSELMMTKISHNGPSSSPFSAGNSRAAYVKRASQPHSLLPTDHGAPLGLSTPPASARLDSTPSTPNVLGSDAFAYANGIDVSAAHHNPLSAPISAWSSQVPSPESSPQSQNQQLYGPGLVASMNPQISSSAPPAGPLITRVTPSKGPKSGGIEVTCLGEGFRPGVEILFGDVPAATIDLPGDIAITCLLPPAAQSGIVNVTARNLKSGAGSSPLQDRVPFTYEDDDEKQLMRQLLQMINQQFAGSPVQAQEAAQRILNSSGNNLNNAVATNTNVPMTGFGNWGSNLEDIALRCLELVDLDDKPNLVNLNFRGPNGQGMLHVSASLGYYRLTAGLLARGAHPDLRDNNGMTPMHLACLNGWTQIIRKLRFSGADPSLRSLNGTSPVELASTVQVRTTVEELSFHSRTKSADATPYRSLSRASSAASLHSMGAGNLHPLTLNNVPLELENAPQLPAHHGTPGPAWSTAPLDRLADRTAMHSKAGHALENHASALAANPAMTAWRDQISAQIQQLQQSLHRALPPIPNLPDYQAYPVMRRISNLVPQRGLRSDAGSDNSKLKEAEYTWWELLTRPTTSPPPYDEIYPDRTDIAPAKHAPTPPAAVEETSSSDEIGTVTITRRGTNLTPIQQAALREAHARKMKRLRSDRRLFFLWIPLLLLLTMAMFTDRGPAVWSAVWSSGAYAVDRIGAYA